MKQSTITETINVPVPPASRIALPEYLSVAIIKLEIDARKMREAQLQLLSMHLKAERLEGEWTLSSDLTAAIRVPPQEPAPAE